MSEQGPKIIQFEKGIAKQAQKIEEVMREIEQRINELLEMRAVVEQWTIAAKEQGDVASVQEYEQDLIKLDLLIEEGRLHIKEGQMRIDDRWWQHWQHEMSILETEIQRDILKDIEDELAMLEGMIVMLEATETLSEAQEKELKDWRNRKQSLEEEKNKYL